MPWDFGIFIGKRQRQIILNEKKPKEIQYKIKNI